MKSCTTKFHKSVVQYNVTGVISVKSESFFKCKLHNLQRCLMETLKVYVAIHIYHKIVRNFCSENIIQTSASEMKVISMKVISIG